MKKEYIMPKISVSRFHTENIVTESGMKASDIVENQMGNTTNVYRTAWDDMKEVTPSNILSIN